MLNTKIQKLSVLLFFLAAAFAAPLHAQTVIYVDEDAPGANNGTSWYDAFVDLREALDSAGPVSTLRVAQGTYSPGPAQEDTFQLKNSVILQGGYAGYGEPDPDARDIGLFKTAMDGGNHNAHVVTGSLTDETAVLDGFFITGGNAQTAPDNNGGGMFNHRCNPTIANCTFSENTALSLGGGVYNFFSKPTLTNCTFVGNAADKGGGIYNSACEITLSQCSFDGNSALMGGGMYSKNNCDLSLTHCIFQGNTAYTGGGVYSHIANINMHQCLFNANSTVSAAGVYNSKTNATIILCEFIDNSAEDDGGGMVNNYSDPTLIGCLFSGNSAQADGGGMINIFGAQPLVSHCTFIGNTALMFGGAMNNVIESAPIVRHCLFKDNTSGFRGGAISSAGAPPLVLNCLFTDNASNIGGATYSHNGYPEQPGITAVNCTFFQNASELGGDAMYEDTGSSIISNCILWGHTNNEEIQTSNGANPAITYCCVQGGYAGEGNINQDPLFVDPDNGDFHLTRQSPCINRGTLSGLAPDDWDGDLRPIMGTADMGIDEFSGDHTFSTNNFSVSQSSGGTIPFSLQASTDYSGSGFVILGTLSGTAPGQPLPGNNAVLPLNFDSYTEIVLNRLNGATFVNFLGWLDSNGASQAQAIFQPNQIPGGWTGKTMHFAYALESLDFVSNPLGIQIIH